MEDVDKQLMLLENAVGGLLSANRKQVIELDRLREEKHELEKEIEECKSKIQELQNINKQLKVAGAIGGNPEHRKLMKLKLNQLIKEIDSCIDEVSKVNL